jgi:para-aminobenzoate synthetase component I
MPELLEVLAAQRDEPELWCLAGPWSLLTWDVEPARLADVPSPTGDAVPVGTGWTRFTGSHLIQADYAGTPQVVRVRSALLWAPDGTCHHLGSPRSHTGPAPNPVAPRLAGSLTPAWSGTTHAAKVAALRQRIAAGDCYQVNLTLPFHGTLAAGDDLDVALALLRASPAPFAAFIRRPGRPSLISHSPECLLAVAGTTALTCPIKGTRRAGLGDELLHAPKDQAELAMIVDLMRNDLGRVAIPGSVQVSAKSRLLRLPYVDHLVADIIASLRPGTTWEALLAATFPAGSITGAPKAMAMQHITAQEAEARGAYCGTFGWLGAGGGQLAVAIRTLTVAGNRVTLHAGSGIVADSDGAAEWDEVRAKASAMAAALGGTV